MKKHTLIITSALAAFSAANAQTVIDASLAEVNSLGGGEFEIISDYTFPAEAILEGTTYINAGVTVTINAGSIVRGQPVENPGDVPGSLVASRGATLVVAGTATNPVIFTTAADTGRGRWTSPEAFLDADPKNSPLPPISAGPIGNSDLWGAVTLCGYAPTNRGTADTGVAGESFVEGFPNQSFRNTYGGIMPNDSSGSIRYASIRHTGNTVTEGDEQQGLTLAGVGAGTVLENIDIYCSGDDGIEIFGGTVNLKNVMISYVNDDGFDLDQGWTGNAQNIFVLASNLSGPGNITTGSVAEWDGEDGVSNSTVDVSGAITLTGQPHTAPTMYNFTFFCEGVSSTAVTIDTNFGGNLFNSIFLEIPANGFSLADTGTGNPLNAGFGFDSMFDRLNAGTLNISSNTFTAGAGVTVAADIGANATSDGVIANTVGVCSDNVFSASANPFFLGATNGGVYNDQTAANGVNPAPLTGANSNLVAVVGPFFDATSVRGAFPQSGTQVLWTTGWTAMNVRGILVDAGNAANVVAP